MESLLGQVDSLSSACHSLVCRRVAMVTAEAQKVLIISTLLSPQDRTSWTLISNLFTISPLSFLFLRAWLLPSASTYLQASLCLLLWRRGGLKTNLGPELSKALISFSRIECMWREDPLSGEQEEWEGPCNSTGSCGTCGEGGEDCRLSSALRLLNPNQDPTVLPVSRAAFGMPCRLRLGLREEHFSKALIMSARDTQNFDCVHGQV